VTGQLRRRLWQSIVWRCFIKRFEFWQQRGLHVVPNHFYQPIPDTSVLSDQLWERRSELVGIDMRAPEQQALLGRIAGSFKREYEAFPSTPPDVPYRYSTGNDFFKSVDAAVLYSLIRLHKPRRMIEVGSGNSTYAAAEAIRRNESEGHPCHLTAVEPYPSGVLSAGFPGLGELLARKAEDVPLERFQELGENDLLFVDSSHVLKIGGDVQYLFLEVFPRLHKGVLVHLHEIFLPREYPREWIKTAHVRQFWTEQYLLQCFLTFNEHFQVIWAGQFMHRTYPALMQEAFGAHDWDHSMSFWIQRVR
jgi:hypothetical protein